MPIKSDRQRRAMYTAKAGNSTLGIPQKVGAEFVAAGPASSNLPAVVPKTRIGSKSYPPKGYGGSSAPPFGSFLGRGKR